MEQVKLRFAGLCLLQSLRSQQLLTLKELRSRSRAKSGPALSPPAFGAC